MHNNESIEYNVILMMKMVQVIVFLPGIYISREIAEKHKPEDYEWPWEEVAYEVIEQEIIEE